MVEKIQEINKLGGWKCGWRVGKKFKVNRRVSMFIRKMRATNFDHPKKKLDNRTDSTVTSVAAVNNLTTIRMN